MTIEYDNGKQEEISGWEGLQQIQDYSALPLLVENSINDITHKVEKKISGLEQSLREVFDETYLEMVTGCLAADAGYSNARILEFITESRTFSLEKIADQCRKYEHHEDLKAVLSQCSFYGDLIDYLDQKSQKKERSADREMRWLQANQSAGEGDLKEKIDNYQAIIAGCQKNRSFLPPVSALVEQAKSKVDQLDERYYRVYNKTNTVLLTYSDLYDKLINKLDLKEARPQVDALVDNWTADFLLDSTKRAVATLESAEKELDRRRNPIQVFVGDSTNATEDTVNGNRGSKSGNYGLFIIIAVIFFVFVFFLGRK